MRLKKKTTTKKQKKKKTISLTRRAGTHFFPFTKEKRICHAKLERKRAIVLLIKYILGRFQKNEPKINLT